MSPRRRAAIIQTFGGLRRTRNRAGGSTVHQEPELVWGVKVTSLSPLGPESFNIHNAALGRHPSYLVWCHVQGLDSPAGRDNSVAFPAPSLGILRHCDILPQCSSDRLLSSASAVVSTHPFGPLGICTTHPQVLTHSGAIPELCMCEDSNCV